MNIFQLEHDIPIFCITAESFPAGVETAHQKLRQITGEGADRKFFGVSWMGKDNHIIYKAGAAELYTGELSAVGLEQFIIKKGDYIYSDIKNYMQNISAIKETFEILLSDRQIDPQGACVEWYTNETDCRCMIRILSS